MGQRREDDGKKPSFDWKEELVNKHDRHSVSWIWPIILLAAGCLLFYIVHVNDHALPEGISRAEAEENPELFSAERARETLRKFTRLGERIVGHPTNEVEVPRILREEFEAAQFNASTVQSLHFSNQKGDGAYTLDFSIPFTNIYENVQNVVMKLNGSDGRHSILINCHYDSVYETEGASDDVVSCAIMMEALRVLSQSPTQLKHNLIFLFNGAEEVPLQGSHLFTTKHDWAQSCRMVINLEGAGAGGRAILFQAGPDNPWLLKTYAKHAPHPHGQIFGEDMFQSGLVPSDTDFRIFRDYGNMPGLDMAFCRNGFVYHTIYDAEQYIPLGSYQHMGDNLVELLRAFGNAEELDDMQRHADGRMVYYDYLGWFMISYSSGGNIAINIITILVAGCSIAVFIGRLLHWNWLPYGSLTTDNTKESLFSMFKSYERVDVDETKQEPVHMMSSKKRIIAEFALIAGVRVVSMLVAVGVTMVVALVVDAAASLAMPWYSNSWLLFPLYWCPCMLAYSLTSHLIDAYRIQKHGLSLSATAQMNILATQSIWLLLYFIFTCMNIRSASIFFIPTIFGALANFIIFLTPIYLTAQKWIWVYLVIHIPGLLWNLYITLILYVIFVPVMGRSGVINADLFIAVVTSIVCILVTSYVVPLMVLVRKSWLVYLLAFIFMFLMIIISLSTNVGHPYRAGPGDPKPQRYWVMHSDRRYHRANGSVRNEESGYFVLNLDRNSPKTIPERGRSNMRSLMDDCEDEPYCGLPLYMTRMVPLSKSSSWIQAEKPTLEYETSMISEKICDPVSLNCTVKLTLKGPDRLTVTLVPRVRVTLVSWDVPTEIKPSGQWQERPTYYLHIVRAQPGPKPDYEVTLNFQVTPSMLDLPILDIGLAGNQVHHKSMRTSQFQSFLDSLPDYTTRIGWISAYRSYVI